VAPFKAIFEKKIKSHSEVDSGIILQLISRNAPGRRIFLEDFFSTLKKVFPSEEAFSTVLDSVMILIRRGIDRWRFPLFTLLTHILRYPFLEFSQNFL
jgi:hypothetical protein